MKTDNQTDLIMTMGGRGGVGKTCSLMAIANHLQGKGIRFGARDCDTENAGKFSAFAHWFAGKAVQLNLRNPEDCDRLLLESASLGVPYVLADLPANASGDLMGWWKQAVKPAVLAKLRLRITAVGVVTPQYSSAESVCEWIDALGPNVRYLIALNRLSSEKFIAPTQKAFGGWFRAAQRATQDLNLSVYAFEVPHLYDPDMECLVTTGQLPVKALPTLTNPLTAQRVQDWQEAIDGQLDQLGLFPAPAASAPKAKAAEAAK